MEAPSLLSQVEARKQGSALNLADMFLGDEACACISEYLPQHPEIESVDLKGNNITQLGIAQLHGLKDSAVKIISFQWNNLGSEEAINSLAELLSQHQALTHVDLRNNRITSAAVQRLVHALGSLPNLELLDLRWNNLTEDPTHLVQGTSAKVELLGNPIKVAAAPSPSHKSLSPSSSSLTGFFDPRPDLTKRLVEEQAAREHAELKLRELTERYNQLETNSMKELTELQARLDLVLAERTAVEDEVKRSKGVLETLASSHETEVKALEKKLNDLTEEVTRLNSCATKESEKLRATHKAELEELKEIHEAGIAHKDGIIQTLRKERDALDTELRNVQDELMDYRKKHASALRELEAALTEEHLTSTAALDKKVKHLQDENVRHRKTINELQEKLSTLA